jgi:hypothetical protein
MPATLTQKAQVLAAIVKDEGGLGYSYTQFVQRLRFVARQACDIGIASDVLLTVDGEDAIRAVAMVVFARPKPPPKSKTMYKFMLPASWQIVVDTAKQFYSELKAAS